MPIGHRLKNQDRKSTRLNSSHTEIYTLSLHDALPICICAAGLFIAILVFFSFRKLLTNIGADADRAPLKKSRSEEHTSELQSHRDLHSFPTRRSSDLHLCCRLIYRHTCFFLFS